MAFSYANPGSGPSAGGIGWFDFGNFTITPGQTVNGLTGTLANGITVSFDLTLSFLGGAPRNFIAVPSPSVPSAYFGTAGYTGIAGNVILYSGAGTANNLSNLIFSNIVVKDAQGNLMPNYTVILADGENTSGIPNFEEGLSFTTNGGDWVQLAALGNNNPPVIVGGGQFIGFIGKTPPPNTAYVYSTQSPTQVVASLQEAQATTFQGIAIGFAATQIQLYKNLTGRISDTDQFELQINGTPSDTATTTGTSTGLQTEFASIAAIPGTPYSLNEVMAPGSANPLTSYSQTITAINLTPNGTIPPLGSLPINLVPALGDVIKYTILNTADTIFTKTVDKSYAQPGDILTYSVTVDNPNNFAINNVLVTDAVPSGTSYIGNLVVSGPYTGIDPANGITLTTIAADSSVTLSWQVQVNNSLPITNPIANVATVDVPGGNSGTTNMVTTQINKADLSSPGSFIKTATPVSALPGSIVTYTLQLTNTGNVPANNVVVKDLIPSSTTYVANSISSNVAFTGSPLTSITLTAPILPGNSAVITFQVQLGNEVPSPNPILNTALVDYKYTVNPDFPNGVSASGSSNTASVNVINASLSVAKTTDKSIAYVGDILTYHVIVSNTGNVPADSVKITDALSFGTSYVPGSITGNVAFTGDPTTTIDLTNPLLPGEAAIFTFQAKIDSIPVPNPIRNIANVNYQYTIDPSNPDGASGSSVSNGATTAIFANNYSQQINDLIESIALQEAALASIANAEGAKIQKFVAMPDVTPQMLLCLNKSVTDMTDAITTLESILKQKLNAVECQINANCKQ